MRSNMQKKTMCGTFLAAMAIVAHGAALLEADGLVTEKSAGWRFEASGAKGGAAKSDKNGGTVLGTIVKRSFVQAGKNQHGDSKIVECRSGFAMAEWCRSEK